MEAIKKELRDVWRAATGKYGAIALVSTWAAFAIFAVVAILVIGLEV